MDRVPHRSILATFALLTVMLALPCRGAVSGEMVYQKRCASCHDSAGERTPPRDALKQLSVARILRTLDFGVMINIAYVLNREEREAVANFLGVQRPDAPVPPQAFCADRTVNIGQSPSPAWNGWGPKQTLHFSIGTSAKVQRARGSAQEAVAETDAPQTINGDCCPCGVRHHLREDARGGVESGD